jgi:hypothetical protein
MTKRPNLLTMPQIFVKIKRDRLRARDAPFAEIAALV